MRTLFTLILAATLLTSLQAQVAPGDKFLGGRLSFSFNNQSSNLTSQDRSSFRFAIGPRMGFLIKDNLAVGVAGSFSYSKQPDITFFSTTNPNPIILNGDEVTQYGIGPFLRHYTPFTESAGLIVDLNTQVGGGKVKEEVTPGGEFNSTLFNLEVSILPGFYYFFSPHFCLEASFGGLGYSFLRSEGESSTFSGEPNVSKSSNLTLSLATQFSLSFNYYFLKK